MLDQALEFVNEYACNAVALTGCIREHIIRLAQPVTSTALMKSSQSFYFTMPRTCQWCNITEFVHSPTPFLTRRGSLAKLCTYVFCAVSSPSPLSYLKDLERRSVHRGSAGSFLTVSDTVNGDEAAAGSGAATVKVTGCGDALSNIHCNDVLV